MVRSKTTSTASYEGLPINTANGQCSSFEVILEQIKACFDYMLENHNKVLFIRFDLRFPQDYQPQGGNDEVSKFFKNINEQLKHRGIGAASLWVREQHDQDRQHYHCFILLDGNKVQDYYSFLIKAQNTWGRLLKSPPAGLVFFCDQDGQGNRVENGIMIRRPPLTLNDPWDPSVIAFWDAYDRSFYWASYLAKVKQKSLCPPNVRSYQASQLRF